MGQHHCEVPGSVSLPVSYLVLDSTSGNYSKGFQPGSDLSDPQPEGPTHLLLPPTM